MYTPKQLENAIPVPYYLLSPLLLLPPVATPFSFASFPFPFLPLSSQHPFSFLSFPSLFLLIPPPHLYHAFRHSALSFPSPCLLLLLNKASISRPHNNPETDAGNSQTKSPPQALRHDPLEERWEKGVGGESVTRAWMGRRRRRRGSASSVPRFRFASTVFFRWR